MLKRFLGRLGKFFQGLFKKNKKPVDISQLRKGISITLPIEISKDDIYELREETWHEFSEELKKLDSTYYPILPKRIPVKTLIVSVYTAWSYDSVGVDLSLLEEHGIAHYFTTSTQDMEHHLEQYDGDDIFIEGQGVSCLVNNAVLLDYGDGRWDWYEV